MHSCLLCSDQPPSEKGSTLNGKNLLPPFRTDLNFQKGDETILRSVNVSIPLNEGDTMNVKII